MPFDGLCVLSVESRRAAEIGKLICARGGDALVQIFPSPNAFSPGDFGLMVFLAGAGSRFR
jgi:hypothetical protein